MVLDIRLTSLNISFFTIGHHVIIYDALHFTLIRLHIRTHEMIIRYTGIRINIMDL
jgi:hypothetical protein